MSSTAYAAKRYLPEWNEKTHPEAEALDFCERHDISIIETDLIENLGAYLIYRDRHFILIHQFLAEYYRAWVLWHEIGHFILHHPGVSKFSANFVRKIDLEANIVAAVALIPLELVRTKTAAELNLEFNFPKDLIKLRKYIYETYKL